MKVVREDASQAFLLIHSSAADFAGGGTSFTLSGGSLHLRASEFAPASTDFFSGFLGFKIVEGTLAFRGEYTFDAASQTLTLLEPHDDPGPFPGLLSLSMKLEYPGSSSVELSGKGPQDVVLEFDGASSHGGALVSATNGSLLLQGNTVSFTYLGKPPEFNADLASLGFEFQSDQSKFSGRHGPGTLVEFMGTAAIAKATWIIPVSFQDQSTLGEVVGSGSMGIELSPGLSMKIPSLGASLVCGKMLVAVQGNDMSAVGSEGKLSSATHTTKLWSNSSVTFRKQARTQITYFFQQAGSGEALVMPIDSKISLNKPCTINGADTVLSGQGTLALTSDAQSTSINIVSTEGQASPAERQSYALKNALFQTNKVKAIRLVGVYSKNGGGLSNAGANVTFELAHVVPFLPDPYTTNLAIDLQNLARRGLGTDVELFAVWNRETDATIDVKMDPTSLSELVVLPRGNDIDMSRSDGGRLLPLNDRIEAPPTTDEVTALIQQGPLLLDLSSNASQFGVRINTASDRSLASMELSVSDLLLHLPYRFMNLTALPAVQWEPVTAVESSKSLDFAGSGPTTVMGSDTVSLTPVTPRHAIDGFIFAAQPQADPPRFSVRFGLPSGIVAYSTWPRTDEQSPRVLAVQPKFSSPGLTGGDQVSIQASSRFVFPPNRPRASPHLPGVAQLRVTGARSGADASAIGKSDFIKLFNDTFGKPGGKIPVTRVDISGYGESLFSDWRNIPNTTSGAVIEKVQFQTAVGRTIREVVQITSICYCYCWRATKTIETERASDGKLYIRESGWEPTADGVGDAGTSGIINHAGVFRHAKNITNVREIGGRSRNVLIPGAAEPVTVQAVLFNCTLDLEGTANVPALDQLGYIPLGEFTPAHYAQLLDDVGTLGRPIDTTIDVASTGLEMKVQSVGVGKSQETFTSVPEFAIVAFGSVHFPRVGEWTFAKRSGQGYNDAVLPVDPNLGVPLIRRGKVGFPPLASSPYRFASAANLLLPDDTGDHSIIFSTGTQKVQFPCPLIWPDGLKRITSLITPYVADIFALGMDSGLFPPSTTCLSLPNSNYSLDIKEGGDIALSLPGAQPFDLLATRPKSVAEGVASSTVIELGSSDTATPGTVELRIDTTAAVPWTLNIRSISFATTTLGQGVIIRFRGNLLSDAASPMPRFEDSNLEFGPSPGVMAKLIGFFGAFGPLPKMDTGLTNEWQVFVGLSCGKKDIGKAASNIPVVKQLLEFFKVIQLKIRYHESRSQGVTSTFAEAEMRFDIGTGFFAALIIGGGYEIPRSGSMFFKFEAGVGFGWEKRILGKFGATVEVALILLGELVTGQFLAGGKIRGSLELDLSVARVSAMWEGSIRKHRQECIAEPHAGSGSVGRDSIWTISQQTAAIEVHIFWVIDIEFEWHDENHQKENNGHCDWVAPAA